MGVRTWLALVGGTAVVVLVLALFGGGHASSSGQLSAQLADLRARLPPAPTLGNRKAAAGARRCSRLPCSVLAGARVRPVLQHTACMGGCARLPTQRLHAARSVAVLLLLTYDFTSSMVGRARKLIASGRPRFEERRRAGRRPCGGGGAGRASRPARHARGQGPRNRDGRDAPGAPGGRGA